MTCPHCHAPLSESEIKAIWGAYTSSRRKHRGAGKNGGRPVECFCNKCASCKRRAKRRAAKDANVPR